MKFFPMKQTFLIASSTEFLQKLDKKTDKKTFLWSNVTGKLFEWTINEKIFSVQYLNEQYTKSSHAWIKFLWYFIMIWTMWWGFNRYWSLINGIKDWKNIHIELRMNIWMKFIFCICILCLYFSLESTKFFYFFIFLYGFFLAVYNAESILIKENFQKDVEE